MFQRWKDYEKQRRVMFANVMKERRRLKALLDKPHSPNPSLATLATATDTAASASVKLTRPTASRSPPS